MFLRTLWVALVCGALPAFCVTQIDYNTQVRNKPILAGNPLPTSCSIAGNFFFLTGANLLYVCDGSTYQITAGVIIASGSTTPGSCSGVSALFYNTVTKALFVCDGSIYVPPIGNLVGLLLGNGPAPITAMAIGAPLNYLRSQSNSTVPRVEFAPWPSVEVRDFDFPARHPGVDLSAGITADITLTPVPLGVYGGTTGHSKLYIEGGTGGGPEVVLLTGPGCPGDGVTTCIVHFTPVNPHGGDWTLRSSTAGAYEAVAYAQRTRAGRVHAKAAAYDLHSSVYIDVSQNLAVIFAGDGIGYDNLANGTVFNNLATGTPAFEVVGDAVTTGCEAETLLRDFTIHGSPTSGTGLSASNACGLRIDYVYENNSGLYGFSCGPNCYTVTIEHSLFYSNALDGIFFSGVPNAVHLFQAFTQANCKGTTGTCSGLHVDGAFGLTIEDSGFALDGGFPLGGPVAFGPEVAIYNSKAVKITGSYAEQPLSNAVYLDPAVSGFDISTNYFQQGGIDVSAGAKHGTIANNYLISGNQILSVTNVVNNAGLCQITVAAPPTPPAQPYTGRAFVDIESVGGVTACNGKAQVQSVQSGTQFTVGRLYSGGPYTSGGTAEKVSGIGVGGSAGYSDVHWGAGNDLDDTTLYLVGGDLRSGNGPDITAAAVITPTHQFQTVNGGGTIDTMIVASGYVGQFCAWPGAGASWSTSTAGNFANAFTVSSSAQKCWSYDPVISKWR